MSRIVSTDLGRFRAVILWVRVERGSGPAPTLPPTDVAP